MEARATEARNGEQGTDWSGAWYDAEWLFPKLGQSGNVTQLGGTSVSTHMGLAF